MAKEFVRRWLDLARDGDHFTLAFAGRHLEPEVQPRVGPDPGPGLFRPRWRAPRSRTTRPSSSAMGCRSTTAAPTPSSTGRSGRRRWPRIAPTSTRSSTSSSGDERDADRVRYGLVRHRVGQAGRLPGAQRGGGVFIKMLRSPRWRGSGRRGGRPIGHDRGRPPPWQQSRSRGGGGSSAASGAPPRTPTPAHRRVQVDRCREERGAQLDLVQLAGRAAALPGGP